MRTKGSAQFVVDLRTLVPSESPQESKERPAPHQMGQRAETKRLRTAIYRFLPARLDRAALMFDLEPALDHLGLTSHMLRSGSGASPRLGVLVVDPKGYEKKVRAAMLEIHKRAQALRKALSKEESLLLAIGARVGEVTLPDFPVGSGFAMLAEGLDVLSRRATLIAEATVGPNPAKPELRAVTARVQEILRKHGLPERTFFRPIMRAIVGKSRVGERATARARSTTEPTPKI